MDGSSDTLASLSAVALSGQTSPQSHTTLATMDDANSNCTDATINKAASKEPKVFKTEYKAKFKRFDEYVYNESADCFVRSVELAVATPSAALADTAASNNAKESNGRENEQDIDASLFSADGVNSQPKLATDAPWYREVQRRNERASEYRFKSELGHTTTFATAPQLIGGLDGQATATPTAAALVMATTATANGVCELAPVDSAAPDSSQLGRATSPRPPSVLRFSPQDYRHRDDLIARMANNNSFKGEQGGVAAPPAAAAAATSRQATTNVRATPRLPTAAVRRSPLPARARSQSRPRPQTAGASQNQKATPTAPIQQPKTSATSPVKTAAPRLATARSRPPPPPTSKTTNVTAATTATTATTTTKTQRRVPAPTSTALRAQTKPQAASRLPASRATAIASRIAPQKATPLSNATATTTATPQSKTPSRPSLQRPTMTTTAMRSAQKRAPSTTTAAGSTEEAKSIKTPRATAVVAAAAAATTAVTASIVGSAIADSVGDTGSEFERHRAFEETLETPQSLDTGAETRATDEGAESQFCELSDSKEPKEDETALDSKVPDGETTKTVGEPLLNLAAGCEALEPAASEPPQVQETPPEAQAQETPQTGTAPSSRRQSVDWSEQTQSAEEALEEFRHSLQNDETDANELAPNSEQTHEQDYDKVRLGDEDGEGEGRICVASEEADADTAPDSDGERTPTRQAFETFHVVELGDGDGGRADEQRPDLASELREAEAAAEAGGQQQVDGAEEANAADGCNNIDNVGQWPASDGLEPAECSAGRRPSLADVGAEVSAPSEQSSAEESKEAKEASEASSDHKDEFEIVSEAEIAAAAANVEAGAGQADVEANGGGRRLLDDAVQADDSTRLASEPARADKDYERVDLLLADSSDTEEAHSAAAENEKAEQTQRRQSELVISVGELIGLGDELAGAEASRSLADTSQQAGELVLSAEQLAGAFEAAAPAPAPQQQQQRADTPKTSPMASGEPLDDADADEDDSQTALSSKLTNSDDELILASRHNNAAEPLVEHQAESLRPLLAAAANLRHNKGAHSGELSSSGFGEDGGEDGDGVASAQLDVELDEPLVKLDSLSLASDDATEAHSTQTLAAATNDAKETNNNAAASATDADPLFKQPPTEGAAQQTQPQTPNADDSAKEALDFF